MSTEVVQANEELDTDEDGDGVFDDCVTLEISTDQLYRTNSGKGYRSDVVLSVMSASYDRAKDVAKQVRSQWDDGEFSGGQNKITLCRIGSEESEQDEEDGTWAVSLSMTVNHRSA